MPYYHGMILALVIEAGCGDDPRIEAGLEWLLRMRQDDGGWIVPAQAVPPARKTLSFWHEAPLAPDRAKPNSHLATGMALRALAVHPRFRRREEARVAAARLKESFFCAEKYNDRKAPGYWTKLGFPYWWTDLLMALDSVTLIEPGAEDPHVAAGVRWFIDHQDEDGLWPTGYYGLRQRIAGRGVEAMGGPQGMHRAKKDSGVRRYALRRRSTHRIGDLRSAVTDR